MEKRTNSAARALAVLALAGAAVILIVAVASSLGGDGDSSSSNRHGGHVAARSHQHRTHAATYVVETGDTLTAIAHQTGVPVARILRLNPEVDPQILIAGETLKLR
jgi:LysM repeat protein